MGTTFTLVTIPLLHDLLQGTCISLVGLIKGYIGSLTQYTFSTVVFSFVLIFIFLILQSYCGDVVILFSISIILNFQIGLDTGLLFIV